MKEVHLKGGAGRYKTVLVGSQFSQVYDDAISVVNKITAPSALHLLFWVISNMSTENIITLRKNEKLNFISICSAGGVRYSISTVNKAVKILVDSGVLASWSSEDERMGTYLVNPRYFWKGNDQRDRYDLISKPNYFNKDEGN